MKIGALVAEFNPIHAGHKILIDKIREENDAVIATMSGNFVQRGECAIFEKGERAKAAIGCGVDLVLELPSVFALSSAEGFAKGSIGTLSACGCVDSLYFGSECGDIEKISRCADALNLESAEFSKTLSEKLAEGMNFPAARQAALQSVIPEGEILDMPNNILGVEYVRELKRLHSSIIPHTIKRVGAGYNDFETAEEIPSASSIRNLIKNDEDANKLMLGEFSVPVFMKDFDIIVASRLKAISKEELMLIPDCNEEIATRLKSACTYNTFEEIVENASCKSYTQSRIRRILCNMVIGNNFSLFPTPSYIRPLAFSDKGSEILRKMKSTASLPVAARGAVLKDDFIFHLECRATDIYNLARGIEGGKEFDFVPAL